MQWLIRFRKSCRISQELPEHVSSVPVVPIFRNRQITEEMKLAAAAALAGLVSDEELSEDFIMPDPFDPRIVDVVSKAVKDHIEK